MIYDRIREVQEIYYLAIISVSENVARFVVSSFSTLQNFRLLHDVQVYRKQYKCFQ